MVPALRMPARPEQTIPGDRNAQKLAGLPVIPVRDP